MDKSAEHVDGPRSECPGCIAADELVEKMVAAARRQIASTDPTDGHIAADELARMILDHFGIE